MNKINSVLDKLQAEDNRLFSEIYQSGIYNVGHKSVDPIRGYLGRGMEVFTAKLSVPLATKYWAGWNDY